MRILIQAIIYSITIISSVQADFTHETESGDEIPVITSEAETNSKKLLFIHLPSHRGISDHFKKDIYRFGEAGINIWSLDLVNAYMMSPTKSSFKKTETDGIMEILDLANEKGYENIFLYSHSMSSWLAVKVAHQYQMKSSRKIRGHIMHAPNLWDLDKKGLPTYSRHAQASNLPIYIFFEKYSTKYPFSEQIAKELSVGGSKVYVHRLHKLTSAFLHRPPNDLTKLDKETKKSFHKNYRVAADILMKTLTPELKPLPKPKSKKQKTKSKNLVEYKPRLESHNMVSTTPTDDKINIKDFKGKVVLVNFWASWCAPCIEEIPSMEKLIKEVGDGFEILAINVGEDKLRIKNFKQKIKFTFPVVMDETGKISKDWNVYAYPSNYILDKNGKVVYSYKGALDWSEKTIVDMIKKLIKE